MGICTNCGEADDFGKLEVFGTTEPRRVARHEHVEGIIIFALNSTPGLKVKIEPRGRDTQRRNDIQVLAVIGNRATGFAGEEYDIAIVSLSSPGANAIAMPLDEEVPTKRISRVAFRHPDDVAGAKMRNRPTSTFPFRPLAFTLSGLMQYSDKRAFMD